MKSHSKKKPMKSNKKLTPLIDTLPLSLASKFAKTEKEATLCLDLAFSITEGSPTAKNFYNSGEARQILSERSYTALGEVLNSADKYFSDLRAKRKISFKSDSSSHDSDEVVPVTKVVKKKQVSSSDAQPKRKEHEAKRKSKGKVVTSEQQKGKQKGKWEVKGKAAGKVKVEPAAADEDKLVIEPADDDEASVGAPGPPGFPGWYPKHVLYLETDTGFKKFRVYEDYDSGLSSGDGCGKDIPLSPNFSEEWDPKKHAFLLLKKRPDEESSGVLFSCLPL